MYRQKRSLKWGEVVRISDGDDGNSLKGGDSERERDSKKDDGRKLVYLGSLYVF